MLSKPNHESPSTRQTSRRKVAFWAVGGMSFLALCGGVAPSLNAAVAQPSQPSKPHIAATSSAAVGSESTEYAVFENEGVSSLGYTPAGAVQTGPNEPFGGATFSTQPDGNVGVVVKATLGTTTDVAQWFKGHAAKDPSTFHDGHLAVVHQAGGASTPSKLSFVIPGNLTINGNSYPLMIGQGRDWLGLHNWWLGGTAISSQTSQGQQPAQWQYVLGWVGSGENAVGEYFLETPDGKYFITTSNQPIFKVYPASAVYNVS